MLFAIKLSLNFRFEVDRVMKDWWRMTSLKEHLKASCFYFACLTITLIRQLQFACFFVEENSSPLLKQHLPELEGFPVS